MKKLLLLFCSFSLLFVACNEDESSVESIINGSINLSDLKAGQSSQFISYNSQCDYLSDSFSLTGDTLIVEVIEEYNVLKFKESFTEYSPTYLSGMTEPVIHSVLAYENFVLIPERFNSNLFFFYGNDTIHIKNFTPKEMVQNSCKIDYDGSTFIGDEIGKVDKFTVGDFEHQEKTVVSCLPMWFDFDAYLIYDEEQLLMSHTINRMNNVVSGWTILK